MSGWLLIVTLSMPGVDDEQVAIGILFSAGLCESVGIGVVDGLERETPGLRARWTCRELVSGVAA
jgi:hypothetical protein